MEFYHHQLTRESTQLPRIFGMLASLIKTKACQVVIRKFHDLEDIMNSKHECSISKSNLTHMSAARRRLSKLYSAFLFCLSEMGAWMDFEAAEFLSRDETDLFS
ncbi:hypothetical protein P3L10_015754 [Capsicum annuum]